MFKMIHLYLSASNILFDRKFISGRLEYYCI